MRHRPSSSLWPRNSALWTTSPAGCCAKSCRTATTLAGAPDRRGQHVARPLRRRRRVRNGDRSIAAEPSSQPHRLEIEITEGLLLGDTEAVMSQLAELKRIGVSIVMDDFGTGYSSLSYLWRFHFDKIKIDQSFMKAFDQADHDAETIVKTIVALGRSLHMQVTVEGVETSAAGRIRARTVRRSSAGVLLRPSDAVDRSRCDFGKRNQSADRPCRRRQPRGARSPEAQRLGWFVARPRGEPVSTAPKYTLSGAHPTSLKRGNRLSALPRSIATCCSPESMPSCDNCLPAAATTSS